MDEVLPLIKEAIDRKQENLRRRKKRDILRLSVVKIFRTMAENGIFAQRSVLIFIYVSSFTPPIYSSPNTNINKLQITQNTALRIATGCTTDTNTQHLHDKTHI